ncbi:MAG TPA: hypothetical protein PK466_08770 [Thermotogota bacterium]|nr:hypothetical protein [Thermotogota bacterium]HPJ89213.1 hypothetical protein [Thermotogota bacterium]HPR96409.1 hypothetical protein [Thermotogota bacterium]
MRQFLTTLAVLSVVFVSIVAAAPVTLHAGTAFDYTEGLSFFLGETDETWFDIRIEMTEQDWTLMPLTAMATDTEVPTSTGGPGGEDDQGWL